MVIFYPFRLFRKIITYKPKTCFWGHDWGKWTQDTEVWVKREREQPYREFEYKKAVQLRFCKRCNKAERIELK